MTQEGIVTKALNNGLAEVMVERTTACGECANREVCHYTSEVRTFAKNSIGAREGEKVIIQSKSSEIIGAAFLLYIVPLAVLLLVTCINLVGDALRDALDPRNSLM